MRSMHTSLQGWLEAIKCSASPTQVMAVSAKHPQAYTTLALHWVAACQTS